jgi:hypothetical protein
LIPSLCLGSYQQELARRQAGGRVSARAIAGLETYDYRANPDYLASFALDSEAILNRRPGHPSQLQALHEALSMNSARSLVRRLIGGAFGRNVSKRRAKGGTMVEKPTTEPGGAV